MRLRNDPNAKKIVDENDNFFIKEDVIKNNRWNKIFKNNNPIYLEIGSGKGKFIIDNAIKYPNINFIGIEKNITICAKILKKVNEVTQDIDNLKILNIDASSLLDYFQPKEISKIYLNFSDPWPKKRHHKNRLTHQNFLNIYEKLLNDGSYIELKTDNDEFFNWTIDSLNFNNWKIIYQTTNLYHELDNKFNKENIATEYELRFINENKNINKIIFSK